MNLYSKKLIRSINSHFDDFVLYSEESPISIFQTNNQKFASYISKISFAYRANLDEFRVQISKKNRENLLKQKLKNFSLVLAGYHSNSDSFTFWDSQLIALTEPLNRSLYTRQSICNVAKREGVSLYNYYDKKTDMETTAISLHSSKIHFYFIEESISTLHKPENAELFAEKHRNENFIK